MALIKASLIWREILGISEKKLPAQVRYTWHTDIREDSENYIGRWARPTPAIEPLRGSLNGPRERDHKTNHTQIIRNTKVTNQNTKVTKKRRSIESTTIKANADTPKFKHA